MAVFVMVFLVILVLCIFTALLKWNELRYRKKGLPPGTMGWPLFGESTDFLKEGPNFMKKKKARYGSFFKTHVLGAPTIVSMEPEVNRYILLNEAKGLVAGYSPSMVGMLGQRNISAVHGSAHKKIRGSILSVFSPNVLRDQVLQSIDPFMRSHLSNWDGKVIDIQQKTKEMALLSSLNEVASVDFDLIREAFAVEYWKLMQGMFSLPINIPGTSYWRGLQARKNIIKIWGEIIQRRRASPNTYQDMLDFLLKVEDPKYKLNEEELIDQLFTILYSGFETVSVVSMMAIKYLHDNPRALQEFREEHLAIRKDKGSEEKLTWDDFKSMRFTRAVILETTRLATVVNGVLRKTIEDVEVNGYVVPKGWRIYVYIREINYDPILYPEPFTFNPWRWMDNKSMESHNHFMVFGSGGRLCPGKELGILEISTFLHYFVTRYRWEEVGGDKLVKFPRVAAPNGLHIRVSTFTDS